jgi:FixJ family two-component response regulator
MGRQAVLIAVVDDDESVRESLPALLDEFGFRSETFATSEECLESGVADKAACLILDIAMPGKSGPELRRELLKRGYSIPTIFISAHAEFASQTEIREGVVDWLTKPFSDTALLEALKRALNLQ